MIKQNTQDKLTDFGKATLKDRYLQKGEDFNDLFTRVATAYSDDIEHGQRLYNYMSNMWFMPATPILSNGGTTRGLPISCFLNEASDNLKSIATLWNENIFLASSGGGIGSFIGNIRSINEKISNKGTTSGVIPFIKVIDSMTLAISQGCYDDKTEILTEQGFIKFNDLPNYDASLKVAQVTEDASSMSFVNYTNYIKYHVNEELYSFQNKEKHVNLLVTNNHRMLTQKITQKKVDGHRVKKWNSLLKVNEADKLSCNRDVRFVNSAPIVDGTKSILTPYERFLIAYQADGATSPSGSSNGNVSGTVIYNFHFSKQRKIDRLTEILQKCELYYTILNGSDGTTTICVRTPVDNKPHKVFSSWVNFQTIDSAWCKEFIEEVGYWDGSHTSENAIRYSSVHCENVNIVQTIAVMAGYKTKLIRKVRDTPRQDIYTVLIVKNSRYTSAGKISLQKIQYNGNVYCVTVPSGNLVVRRDGAVVVCGNSLRRGSAAVYMQDSHPEIEEFVDIRRPTGGDPNRRSLNIHHGVCLSDAFMKAAEGGKPWELKSPATGKTIETISARDLWIKILSARIETGEPYILYTDSVNKYAPPVYQKLQEKGMFVKTSNLCSEITLQTGMDWLGKERTAVCCLSSLNLEYYEEWKGDPLFVSDIMRFLDNVLQDFIDRAPNSMERAKYSAMRERSVGLGVMGFHSFLQSKMTPLEGVAAKSWNKQMFKHIKTEVDKINVILANEKGACPDAKDMGLNLRFSNSIAIAPTASISIICGNSSPGIEPFIANCYTHKTLSGTFIVRNKHLQALLKTKGFDNKKTWSSIAINEGSIQHLDCLTPEEKDVFKTAMEINQMWLIDHAADRQPFVCQAQSLNIFAPSDVEKRTLHDIHFSAWKKGLKSLYYCRSSSIQRAEKHTDIKAAELPTTGNSVGGLKNTDECLSCQ